MVYGQPWNESESPGANPNNDCNPVAIATCLSRIAAMPLLVSTVGPLILGGIGFGATGPIAGTIAPVIQARLGPIAAGSLFANLQSAAMSTTSFWGGFGANMATGATHAFCLPEIMRCMDADDAGTNGR